LEKLWEEARKILEEVYEGDPKEELDKTEDIIKGFSDRDAFGTAFRYPTDIEDKKSLPNLSHINVRKFFEFVSKVSELLDGASMGIDEYLAWKMDI
jgi:hypothetical protein